AERREGDALVQVAELDAVGLERREVREDVVALDVRDAGGDAELLREAGRLRGEPRRVQAAGVDDDLDPALDARPEHLFQLAEERLGVAGARALHAVLEQDHERQLGEVVAGQDVDRAALDHLARGAQAVAVEAAAIRDAKHGVAHAATLPFPSAPAQTIRAPSAAFASRRTLACLPRPPPTRRARRS